jgi:hypothetical protein
MKFNNFVTLCSAARFINIDFADTDVLTTVSVPASSDTEACLCELDRTEGYDYLIRKEDVEAMTPEGKGFKVKVLVFDPASDEEGDTEIIHNGDTHTVRDATLSFLALRTMDPEKVLASA